MILLCKINYVHRGLSFSEKIFRGGIKSDFEEGILRY